MFSKYPDFSETPNWVWYSGQGFLNEWLKTVLDLHDADNLKTSRIVAKNFQSCNKIKEIVNRHVAALAPSHLSKLDPLLQELTDKWKKENAGQFGHPLEEAALKAKVEGCAYLRLYFQQTYTSETKKEALELHCPPRHSVTAYRNGDNSLFRIDYRYTQNGKPLIERQYLQDGFTIIETIEGETVIKQLKLDLGGGFTVFELNLPLLVTESLIQNQNAINSALTLMLHNLLKGGWVQESILNGQPPGTWDYDAKGKERFTPRPEGLPSGAGVTRFIQGLPLRDERHTLTGYTNPEIKIQEPSDPESFNATFRAYSLSMYEQSSQTFVLGADLILSGISREQSRLDFAELVDSDASKFGYCVSDILSVCNFFLGIKEKVKVKILPRIDRGSEHKKLVLTAREQGLVSLRTAIEQLGFASDVEAELAELAKERQAASALSPKTLAATPTGTADSPPDKPAAADKLSDAPSAPAVFTTDSGEQFPFPF